jgi:hypothetical protein
MPAEPSAKGTRRSLRIGPYAVEAPITLGALGSAYRATDPGAGRTVALKVLPPELAGSVAARDRFQREAAKASRVNSPHVVRVLDFGDASGTWYLAMELAEGPKLAEHVQRQGALDAGAARDVLLQVARGLAQLHREGLVPRDLSADNFRVTRRPDGKGRLGVKLLDLGLLRPANDESPADVRAALGSLGATVWFLLTGRTGGKPDLGSLSGDVSDEFRGVLRRLLAQRPEERFPTPAALLEALGEEAAADEAAEPDPEEASAADPLAALAAQVQEDAPPRKPPAAKKPMRRRGEEPADDEPPPRRDGEDEEPAPRRQPAPAAAGHHKALIWGAVAFGAVLTVGAVVVAILVNVDDRPRGDRQAGNTATNNGGDHKPPPADTGKDQPGDPKKKPDPEKDPEKEPQAPPPLYVPKEPIVPDKLMEKFAGPSSVSPQVPEDTPLFRVGRLLPAEPKGGKAFDSVAAACAAIPEGKWGVIEIADNGPLFEGPITLAGRNVYIRAARGYSPLLVWDATRLRTELKAGKPAAAAAKDDLTTFLSVDKGTLALNNIGLAVAWPEQVPGSPCLARVSGGDFLAWESTFSAAGKPRGSFTAVRFEGGAGHTCRLHQCYSRGARLTALDVAAAGADVMIDGSLLVAGEAPALSVAGGKAGAITTLRVLRSTLVARDTALRVRPSPEAAGEPALHWMGWDVLLWRGAETSGGTMVDLPKDAGPKAMTWEAVTSLYVGWETLLSGKEPVPGSDTDAWHARWGLTEGDVSVPGNWRKGLPSDPAHELPWTYQAFGAVAYAATSGTGLLGCDLGQLPWTRPRWIDTSTERTRPLDITLLAADQPMPVPEVNDGLYHGERLDLDKVDLGAYLRAVLKARRPAETVVLHLHGTGKRKTSPVRVEGANLFVYFEPPAAGAEPLVLEPDVTAVPDANAVFEVTRGNLWMIGGDVRCPDFKTALLPRYVVMVREGNLYLTATRLQGPLTQPPATYWGLVYVEGTGNWQFEAMFTASINQCVLLTSGFALSLNGAGLRADVRQSLVVSTKWAVGFQPALFQKGVPGNPTPLNSPAARHSLYGEAFLNVQFTADHSTFAGKDAVFVLDDLPWRTDAAPYLWPVVADPIVVQTKDCAFLNPFADKDGKSAPAALLAYQGVAVQRGVLCWQGEGNVYDKRFHSRTAVVDRDGKVFRPEKPQGHEVWQRLWGPVEAKAILDVPLKATLDLDKLPLEQLALPAPVTKDKPGADLTKLLAPRKAK